MALPRLRAGSLVPFGRLQIGAGLDVGKIDFFRKIDRGSADRGLLAPATGGEIADAEILPFEPDEQVDGEGERHARRPKAWLFYKHTADRLQREGNSRIKPEAMREQPDPGKEEGEP